MTTAHRPYLTSVMSAKASISLKFRLINQRKNRYCEKQACSRAIGNKNPKYWFGFYQLPLVPIIAINRSSQVDKKEQP